MDGLAPVDFDDGHQLIRVCVHLCRGHAVGGAQLARRPYLLVAGRVGDVPGSGGVPGRSDAGERQAVGALGDVARCRRGVPRIPVAGLRPARHPCLHRLRVVRWRWRRFRLRHLHQHGGQVVSGTQRREDGLRQRRLRVRVGALHLLVHQLPGRRELPGHPVGGWRVPGGRGRGVPASSSSTHRRTGGLRTSTR